MFHRRLSLNITFQKRYKSFGNCLTSQNNYSLAILIPYWFCVWLLWSKSVRYYWKFAHWKRSYMFCAIFLNGMKWINEIQFMLHFWFQLKCNLDNEHFQWIFFLFEIYNSFGRFKKRKESWILREAVHANLWLEELLFFFLDFWKRNFIHVDSRHQSK